MHPNKRLNRGKERLLEPEKIFIQEVASAWKSIVKDRVAQKKAKYRELAADLANQLSG